MEYTTRTKIKFTIGLGDNYKEEIQTMECLGFTQEQIELSAKGDIASEVQKKYDEWVSSHLLEKWEIV